MPLLEKPSRAKSGAEQSDGSLKADLDAAWPILPDGRVVLTIFDVKVGMPTCRACLKDFYFVFGDDRLSVGEAITHPRLLREMLAPIPKVGLLMLSTSYKTSERFLGLFDARLVPETQELSLVISRRAMASTCVLDEQQFGCEEWYNKLKPYSTKTENGLIAIIGPALLPRDVNEPEGVEHIVGKGSIFYVTTAAEDKDVLGMPLHIICQSDFYCRNTGAGLPAFHLKPQVEARLGFAPQQYEISEYSALYRRVFKMLGALIVD